MFFTSYTVPPTRCALHLVSMGKGDHIASSGCSQLLHTSLCSPSFPLCKIVVNIFVHVPNPKHQRDLIGLCGQKSYDTPELESNTI